MVVVSIVALPLLGAILGGRNIGELLEFPPTLRIPSGYLRFSWAAAAAVIALFVAILFPWFKAGHDSGRIAPVRRSGNVTRAILPWWGKVAFLWTGGWWLLAWTRWEWFQPLQRYTFFPLWLGFIVSVHALTELRKESSLMRRAPVRWLGLFATSALCWWGFEWLNRFVQNWHYLNVEDFGALAYALHASLCFSTVLPAVAAVAEWIGSHAGWNARVATGPAWRWLGRRSGALVLIAFGLLSLVGTGIWPTWFYPALWVSPLALLLALPVLLGRAGLADEIGIGDWRRAATWMIAALVCGFFWELWNWRSVAKWIYTVPGVERWHLFEMPLLGYAGYLPFGLECLIVTEWVIGHATSRLIGTGRSERTEENRSGLPDLTAREG